MANADSGDSSGDLELIRGVLQHALAEIRTISAGLSLPQLGTLTLAQTVARAVRAHEQRSRTKVVLRLAGRLDRGPEEAPPAVKIALYRVVEEALSNTSRHAGGAGQHVHLCDEGDAAVVEIRDTGPGFDVAQTMAREERLGLVGMRERVESLAGSFRIESEPGKGTTVIARLPLRTVEEG
jgi:signal transduction histidine kinase